MKAASVICALALAVVPAAAAGADTLARVKERGAVACGVADDFIGFSDRDDAGNWSGFHVDFCRAVAAAVLGESGKVVFVSGTGAERLEALAAGDVDLLVGGVSWSFAIDTGPGLEVGGTSYYGGQGFMVPRARGLTSGRELDGMRVCMAAQESAIQYITDFFRANQIAFSPVPVESMEAARMAYLGGECDVYSADVSVLASLRAGFPAPQDHLILPEIISKAPVGPIVRQDDAQWSDIVRWTLNLLVAAEELGATSANVGELAASSDNPAIARLLGKAIDVGMPLGLAPDWTVRVIGAVGNYGEIFGRNIGENTPVGLPRGLNALWTAGGLLYAPPFR